MREKGTRNMNGYKEFVQKNIITIIVGIIIPFAASYTGVKSVLATLDLRVAAIEKRNIAVDPLIPRFISVETHMEDIDTSLREIKEGQIRIEDKIDKIQDKL